MTVHPENNWPIDDLEPVIQRTLDAIEYARGPVEFELGRGAGEDGASQAVPAEVRRDRQRASAGRIRRLLREVPQGHQGEVPRHPGGHEHVLERAEPGRHRPGRRCAGIDIVDEHSYRPSGWVRSNFDYFDKYRARRGRSTSASTPTIMEAATGARAMDDSVFLMMMERNGDLVTMASYAPLFCNVNKQDWGVNLIEFDASRSFAHASYYVQKVFNANRPDVNLATTTNLTPQPDPNAPLMAGKFGLGSWNTSTEFKELRIYDRKGSLAFSDDFKTLENWDVPGIGHWRVKDGVLQQTDKGASPAMLLLKAPDLAAGRATVKARRVGGTEGFLVFFNATSIQRFLFCNYGAAGNKFHAIQDRGTPDGCAFKGGMTTQGGIEMDSMVQHQPDPRPGQGRDVPGRQEGFGRQGRVPARLLRHRRVRPQRQGRRGESHQLPRPKRSGRCPAG